MIFMVGWCAGGHDSHRRWVPRQVCYLGDVLDPKLQATGCATSVARGAWPSAQRACPFHVRGTDEARSAEEAFARRAYAAAACSPNEKNP